MLLQSSYVRAYKIQYLRMKKTRQSCCYSNGPCFLQPLNCDKAKTPNIHMIQKSFTCPGSSQL